MDLQTKMSDIKTLLAERDYHGVPRRKARQVIANLRQYCAKRCPPSLAGGAAHYRM